MILTVIVVERACKSSIKSVSSFSYLVTASKDARNVDIYHSVTSIISTTTVSVHVSQNLTKNFPLLMLVGKVFILILHDINKLGIKITCIGATSLGILIGMVIVTISVGLWCHKKRAKSDMPCLLIDRKSEQGQ